MKRPKPEKEGKLNHGELPAVTQSQIDEVLSDLQLVALKPEYISRLRTLGHMVQSDGGLKILSGETLLLRSQCSEFLRELMVKADELVVGPEGDMVQQDKTSLTRAIADLFDKITKSQKLQRELIAMEVASVQPTAVPSNKSFPAATQVFVQGPAQFNSGPKESPEKAIALPDGHL